MFVEKWMTANPFTLPPHMTISAAALEMSRHRFRHMLIAEPAAGGKKLLGLVSKYDVARAFPKDYNPFSVEVTEQTVAAPLATIMARNVVTVEPYCALEEAARILRERRINALPVVRGGFLVGIITESDIFKALLHMIGADSRAVKLILESGDVKDALLAVARLCDERRIALHNASSFPDPAAPAKVISVFYLSHRPDAAFTQELRNLRFRILRIGDS